MKVPALILSLGTALMLCGGVRGADRARIAVGNVTPDGFTVVWSDAVGDQSIHRTDDGTGIFTPPLTIGDLVSVRLSPWEPTAPGVSPFIGVPVSAALAHTFRIDVVIRGLVNPPGTIGANGAPFAPFKYGQSPLFGFIDVDMDADINTGGEFMPEAAFKRLANVARFGGLPAGPLGARTAQSVGEVDADFATTPQFERSGADFTLDLSGLSSSVLLSGDTNADGIFDFGEVWILKGRFFHRTEGYRDVSKAFGGSGAGLYDPIVKLRFAQMVGPGGTPVDGSTIISLVWALDMPGAAILAGAPTPEPIDLDVSNQSSMLEGMQDVVNFVSLVTTVGPVGVLANGWAGRNVSQFLDPTQWSISAIIGVPYLAPGAARYAWIDEGFDMAPGDVNGDGAVDLADRDTIALAISMYDGTAVDADGVVNGRVVLRGFPANFSVFDVTNDGVVDGFDVDAIGFPVSIVGDLNNDGSVGAVDLAMLIGSWGATGVNAADLNNDNIVGAADLAILIGNWG